ncbi:MAG: hypothetical protein AAF936_08460 [Pseudomonadota bacterium]
MPDSVIAIFALLVSTSTAIYLAYFQTRFGSNKDVVKLLVEKRLGCYGEMSFLLSDAFKKFSRYNPKGKPPNNEIDRRQVELIFEKFKEWDSKNSWLLGIKTYEYCHELLFSAEEFLCELNSEAPDKENLAARFRELSADMRQLELNLRSDIGIYGIVSSANNLQFKNIEKYRYALSEKGN